MARLRLACLVIFLIGVWLIATVPAHADHNIYLPLVPRTPLIQNLQADGEITYCLNSRASTYPNFAAQVKAISDGYTEIIGVRFRRVDYGAGCEVRHDMPDAHGCEGCAAWIYYANWPVVIEYKWQLGYVRWETTIGHELGHGVLGLDEQYADSGGSIRCTGRRDTVMDCGSGVSLPTPLDRGRGCAAIDPNAQRFTGCGFEPFPPPPCEGPIEASGLYWNHCAARWFDAGGWSIDPITQVWFNPQGQPEYTACNQDRLRWNIPKSIWVPERNAFFDPSRNLWSYAGAC